MICIEVKSKKGRLTPEQNEFLKTMHRLGALCLVARSLEDVTHAFSTWMSTLNSGQTDLC